MIPSSRPASPSGIDCSTVPSASTTALIPVVVERSIGSPSSIARSRAWARCWGGPQAPYQPSFEGLNRKSGRLPGWVTSPAKMTS
jgi:hypothetical protein